MTRIPERCSKAKQHAVALSHSKAGFYVAGTRCLHCRAFVDVAVNVDDASDNEYACWQDELKRAKR